MWTTIPIISPKVNKHEKRWVFTGFLSVAQLVPVALQVEFQEFRDHGCPTHWCIPSAKITAWDSAKCCWMNKQVSLIAKENKLKQDTAFWLRRLGKATKTDTIKQWLGVWQETAFTCTASGAWLHTAVWVRIWQYSSKQLLGIYPPNYSILHTNSILHTT